MKQRLNENISEQEVLSLLENVESGSEVTLSGGEPGLCERKFIFKIFRILLEKNTKIKVNTNGLFNNKKPFTKKNSGTQLDKILLKK